MTYDGETQGYYTKVGQLVTINGFIRTDAITVGGATGDVIIGGLPFAVSNNGTGVRSAVSLTLLENFGGDYPSTSFCSAMSHSFACNIALLQMVMMHLWQLLTWEQAQTPTGLHSVQLT